MKSVVLIFDANSNIGYGHLYRILTIINSFLLGADLILIGNIDDNSLTKIKNKKSFYYLDDSNFSNLSNILKSIDYSLIVVDVFRKSILFWESLNQKAPVIAIDDEGGTVCADLVINGTVTAHNSIYKNLRKSFKVLRSERYCIVNPIFAANKWNITQANYSVLIVIGSGERAALWAEYLCRNFRKITPMNVDVTMVVNASFLNVSNLRQYSDASGIRLMVGVSSGELSNMLGSHKLCLITGGMIVYEAIAVGIPALVFPQLLNLLPEMHFLAEKKCIIDLGYEGGFDIGLIGSELNRLLSNRKELVLMSDTQKLFMDGKGVQRIAAEIKSIIKEFNYG